MGAEQVRKVGDARLAALPVHGVDEKLVRRVWSLPDDDPAVDSYPVSPDNVDIIQAHTTARIDLDAYDYHLNQFRDE